MPSSSRSRHALPPLSPYTTLFRSRRRRTAVAAAAREAARAARPAAAQPQPDDPDGGPGRPALGRAPAGDGHQDGPGVRLAAAEGPRSEEHTSELQSLRHLVCRLPPGLATRCRHSLPTRRSSDLGDDGRPLPLPPAKPRALLALLLLNRNRTIRTEVLVDQLWDERPPATATKTVQVYVSQLRKALDRKSTRLNSSHLGISYAVFLQVSPRAAATLSLHDALPISATTDGRCRCRPRSRARCSPCCCSTATGRSGRRSWSTSSGTSARRRRPPRRSRCTSRSCGRP